MGMPGMALPLAAALGIAASSPLPFSWLAGLVFLTPLYLFYRGELRLGPLILGTFAFRMLLAAGAVPFAFEPLGWLASAVVFSGLPLSFHLLRRYAGPRPAWAALPGLLTAWDLLEARYTFLPTYVIVAGNTLASSPFLGLAGWGGFAVLTFFAAAVNLLVAQALRAAPGRHRLAAIGAAVVLMAGGWATSSLTLAANARDYAARPVRASFAAVSTDDAFDAPFRQFTSDTLDASERDAAAQMLSRALRPIREEISKALVDLVIIPEDAIDMESWGDRDDEAFSKFGITSGGVLIAGYRELARASGANLTATLTTFEDGKRYNTSLLFNRSGELVARSHKAHLALGGEYWPFGHWRPFYWNWIARLRPEVAESGPLFDPRQNYARGEPGLLAAEGFSFAVPICIEAHDPALLSRFRREGAEFLVHTSNNGWVALGLAQYLRLTDGVRRVQAVQLGIPIIFNGRGERAGLILPDGTIEAEPFDNAAGPYRIFFGTLRI